MNNIHIEKRKIKPVEYQYLRNSANWGMFDDAVVEKALQNDLFSICVFDDKKLIGMGRVIGDGYIYFYIQDIVVVPEYHKKGIGKIIMTHIEKYLAKAANNNSFIGLMAAKGVGKFYHKFGYQTRPDDAPGMFKRMKK